MQKFAFLCTLFCICLADTCTRAQHALLNSKDFQLDYLNALETQAEQQAARSLNAYLDELLGKANYSAHREDIEGARAETKLQPKIVLIKQLLDEQHAKSIDEDLTDTYVLRNVIFLHKLKLELHRQQEASAQEIRQLRIHRLCKQFRDDLIATHNKQQQQPKTSIINEAVVGAALHKLNATVAQQMPLNVNNFGRQLYERVKITGAEIIDNYLHILRELLQEIIEEKPEHLTHSDKLTKVLQEIEAMLAIKDFYEKRQRLYAYLERNLAADYDQFQNTEIAQQDLTDIFTKLKSKGLDLFVLFLFSNFEFLEHVHHEWQKLLPQTPSALYDEQSRVLHDIQKQYEAFKQDTESVTKYESYVGKLRDLHEQTQTAGSENGHIFEMLNNAAQNVGSVTFNMIKAKCREL